MLVKEFINGYGKRKQLSEESGVPIDTLSKWARKNFEVYKAQGEWRFFSPKRQVWPKPATTKKAKRGLK